MLQPKKTKFRKCQKNICKKKIAIKGNTLVYGDIGIKSLENAQLTARQIEASRIVISKYIKKNGKFWIRIFPDKPISKKPIEVRQGKGKGNVEYWVSVIQPGKIIFEITGVSKDIAEKALKLASYKLPIKTILTFK